MDIQIDSEIHHLSFFRCIGYLCININELPMGQGIAR